MSGLRRAGHGDAGVAGALAVVSLAHVKPPYPGARRRSAYRNAEGAAWVTSRSASGSGGCPPLSSCGRCSTGEAVAAHHLRDVSPCDAGLARGRAAPRRSGDRRRARLQAVRERRGRRRPSGDARAARCCGRRRMKRPIAQLGKMRKAGAEHDEAPGLVAAREALAARKGKPDEADAPPLSTFPKRGAVKQPREQGRLF